VVVPRDNDRVAELLWEYADLLSLQGADRFRIRAYENAARSVAGSSRDLSSLDLKALTSLSGVGKAIAEKIREWFDTGAIAELDALRAEVGAGVRSLLAVPGLGPKRAAAVHEARGISTVEELRAAAQKGQLRDLPGFGAGTEEKILKATETVVGERRIGLGVALGLAEALVERLRDCPQVGEIASAGSLRRRRDTIGDLDVLVASTDPAPVMEAFVGSDVVTDVLAHGQTKSSVMTAEGIQVDLRVVAPEAWGAALLYFTGSKAHNVKLREMAIRAGLKLSEYGLFDGDRVVASRTEDEVYAALGLSWIPPTLREDRGEIEAALAGELPDVIELSDIRGDLHGHTDLTDGVASLQEMVRAAEAKGYAYYAITDHAPLLTMQRMTPEKVLEQRVAVRALEQRSRLRLLHGSELNIARDGSLDWPEEFLDGFDVLVASVHSHFDLPRDEMTRRLLRAIEHPCVNVIGHPTARRMGKRPAIDFDVEAVCKAAAATGTALEVNASPERLDLPDELARAAVEYGVKLAVSTDAHSIVHLDNMHLGVATAQRGWVRKADVVNAMPWRDLKRFLAKGRPASRRP